MGKAGNKPIRRVEAAGNPPLLLAAPVPRIPTGKLGATLVAIMRAEPGRSFTPGELVILAKAKKGNVRKELCRLLLPGKNDQPPPVQRNGPGLYRCFLAAHEVLKMENPPLGVHALQLAWRAAITPRFGGSSGPVAQAPAHIRAREHLFEPIAAQGAWVRDDASRSWRCIRWQGPCKITLQAYPTTGALLASIRASNTPLNPDSLAELRIWLEATLPAYGFTWSEPRVASVEINRDFKTVKLSGMEATRFFLGEMRLSGTTLKLAALQGALVQIYNKEKLGVMRMEIRLHPRQLDIPGLQSLLSTMFYGPTPEVATANPFPPSSPDGGYA